MDEKCKCDKKYSKDFTMAGAYRKAIKIADCI